MIPRPSFPAEREDLEIVVTDDGSRTLGYRGTEVTWRSVAGALSESEWVFLKNGQLSDLTRERSQAETMESIRILETGFGTGLNFWVTASAFLRETETLSPGSVSLDYVSTEPSLLEAALIRSLQHEHLDACQPAYQLFFESVFVRKERGIKKQQVSLRLVDSLERLNDLNMLPHRFDLIYHDPFGPDFAPQLWQQSVIDDLAGMLRPGGRVVTYCVKVEVQKRFKAAGFEIQKTPGPPGGKREVLIAIRI